MTAPKSSFSATVGPGGRVTLPVELRTQQRLKPGDKLRFTVLPDGVAIAELVHLPSYKASRLDSADTQRRPK